MKAGLLTAEEACELADVSMRTLRRWISAGLLMPYATAGRVHWYLNRDVLAARTPIVRGARGRVIP